MYRIPAFILFLLYSFASWTQDISRGLDFLDTQDTIVDPFSIPFYLGTNGEFSLLFKDQAAKASFNFVAQAQAGLDKVLFIAPLRTDTFGFFEQQKGLEWYETKRERGEIGLGLAASTPAGIQVGLSGFKGALQSITRVKRDPLEKTGRPLLPKALDEVMNWGIGDSGSFQRFGGVQVFAGFGVSVVNVVNVGLVIQNLWNLNVKRLLSGKILLTLAEEHTNKRKIQSGATVAVLEYNFFNGKRLSIDFLLDPSNPEHHEFYRLAINGKLDKVQEKLSLQEQRMEWQGSERTGFAGIPGFIGRHTVGAEYIFNFNEEDEEILDLRSKKNSGLLLPVREHNRFVYQAHDSVALIWHSLMSKVNIKLVDKYFVKVGREMGARGFNVGLPENAKMGSALTQLAMSFTRQEVESIDKTKLDEIIFHFKNRCEMLKLACAEKPIKKKVLKKLYSFLDKKWEEYRDELGFILLNHPALVYSYVKALNTHKNISFKFLSEKYQSLEGTAPIDL